MNRNLLLVCEPGGSSTELKTELRKHFWVTDHFLDSPEPVDLTRFPLMLVDIDLKNRDLVESFGKTFPKTEHKECKRVFLVDRACRTSSVQSANLRARETVNRPIDYEQLHEVICRSSNEFEQLLNEPPSASRQSSQDGFECLQRISMAVKDGSEIRKDDISANAVQICAAVADGKTLEWLSAVNNHHSYSYRHSLHVAGLMIAFSEHLKFNESDKSRMVVGALMHDIGKSKLPLTLLDKEGPLTQAETSIFRSHTILGHEILRNDGQWDQLTLDLVYQHHEYIDGTGYPNGLRGDDIIDPVRMLTIVDIFSALVDRRAYKEPMTTDTAMRTLYSMTGKLDMALVQAFEPVGMRLISDLKDMHLAA